MSAARLGPFALVFALFIPASAAAQLAKIETAEVRIVYIEGAETFLVPYAARAFLNSLAFQRRLFGFTPSEKPTILLVDFQDYGNAWASSVPRNNVQVQIAPFSSLFETLPANERLTMIANHELTHVATMDQAAGSDTSFRRLFFGKVNPVAEQPESILYFYLTSPRVAVPRWYQEGVAVFVETWMAAGIGRAQSGYDEMVFRAMVKDGSRFYDPLGLVAEGTKIDFQIGSELVSLRRAVHDLARPPVLARTTDRSGSRGGPAAAPTTRASSGRCSAARSSRRGPTGSRSSGRSRQRTWRRSASTRSRRSTDLSSRALGSVSRAYYDRARGRYLRRAQLPRHRRAHRRDLDDVGDRRNPAPRRHQGPEDLPGRLAGVGRRGHALLHDRQPRVSRSGQARHRDRPDRVLQKDVRVGDLVMNRADKSLWGVRHLYGIASVVPMAPPYTRVDAGRLAPVRHRGLRPRHLARRHAWPRPASAKSAASRTSGCSSSTTLQQGDTTPVAEFDFGGMTIPNSFVFSPDGRFLYGSSYFTGVSNIFRYEIATKSLEAVTNAETGFFRPIPLGNDELIVFRYTGEGFVPARLTARPIQDSEPDHVPRRADDREASRAEDAGRSGSPQQVPFEHDAADARHRTISAAVCSASRSTRSCRATRTRRRSAMRADFSDPLQLNRASLAVSYSPTVDHRPDRNACTSRADYERYDWKAHAAWNDADFYDLFGPTKVSRKGYSVGVSHRSALHLRRAEAARRSRSRARFAGNLDQLPQYQNVAGQGRSAHLVQRRAAVHLSAILARPRGRREGPEGEPVVPKRLRQLRRTSRGFTAPTTSARRCRSAFVDLAAQRGGLLAAGRRTSRLPTSSSAASATTTWITATRSATASTTAFPGAELNEIGGRNFVRSLARVESAAAALQPRRDARRVSELDAAGAVRRRARHEPRSTPSSGGTPPRPAARSTSGSRCCRGST